MPKLGADMTAATLVSWHKQAGESVRRGDVVAEVDTEKGVIDVEIFTNGVLEKLLAQPGQRVPVGAPLALVRESATGPATAPAEVPTSTAPDELATIERGQPTTSDKSRGMVKSIDRFGAPSAASLQPIVGPAARRRARQLGIDPRTVVGATCGGAIMIVNNGETSGNRTAFAAEECEDARPLAEISSDDRTAKMRRAIAVAMSRSKREIPHYYLGTSIDMGRSLKWLAEQNRQRPVTNRLLYGAVVLKAVALALQKYPLLNSVWDGDRAVAQSDIHLGVAISLKPGGLMAPALHAANRLSLDELMSGFFDLVQRARSGALKSSELSDPTVTVTNLGDRGVETVFGVIYPPQVALFGVGRIVERPWAANGQVVVRPIMNVSLSGDHRATDGHYGGLALNEIDRLLQEPEKL